MANETKTAFRRLMDLKLPDTPENIARQSASRHDYRCVAAGPDTEVWSNGVCSVSSVDVLMDLFNANRATRIEDARLAEAVR